MPMLKAWDYVCYTMRGELEYYRWLGDGTLHTLIGKREHFDAYWPNVFPRGPLYRIKWVKNKPVIIKQLTYERQRAR